MDSANPTTTTIAEQPKYNESPRFDLFVKYYTERGHFVEFIKNGEERKEQTFYKAVWSAIKAYDLDPIEKYAYATRWGTELVGKCSFLAREYMDQNGFTFDTMMNIALKNATESKMPSWWDRVMEISGYKKKGPDTLIQNNTQINTTNIQISPEEKARLNKEFYDFIDAKYRAKPTLNPDLSTPQAG